MRVDCVPCADTPPRTHVLLRFVLCLPSFVDLATAATLDIQINESILHTCLVNLVEESQRIVVNVLTSTRSFHLAAEFKMACGLLSNIKQHARLATEHQSQDARAETVSRWRHDGSKFTTSSSCFG